MINIGSAAEALRARVSLLFTKELSDEAIAIARSENKFTAVSFSITQKGIIAASVMHSIVWFTEEDFLRDLDNVESLLPEIKSGVIRKTEPSHCIGAFIKL